MYICLCVYVCMLFVCLKGRTLSTVLSVSMYVICIP